MTNTSQSGKVVRTQIEIDDEIDALGLLVEKAHSAIKPCIDVQILTLGERICRKEIADRWGRSDECHGAAMAAMAWMTCGGAIPPSEGWEVFRALAFGGVFNCISSASRS